MCIGLINHLGQGMRLFRRWVVLQQELDGDNRSFLSENSIKRLCIYSVFRYADTFYSLIMHQSHRNLVPYWHEIGAVFQHCCGAVHVQWVTTRRDPLRWTQIASVVWQQMTRSDSHLHCFLCCGHYLLISGLWINCAAISGGHCEHDSSVISGFYCKYPGTWAIMLHMLAYCLHYCSANEDAIYMYILPQVQTRASQE